MAEEKAEITASRARLAAFEAAMGSRTVCGAKWLQSTITLYNGHTHSCHHPSPHRIAPEHLEASGPSGLHNTPIKHAARAEMMAGRRPRECQYCWTVEDLSGGEHVSDRLLKTGEPQWSAPYLDRAVEAGADGDVQPSYVEVAFDTTCNFKCAYCSPDVSSKWMEESEQHGPYPTSWQTGSLDLLRRLGRLPIPQRAENPYIDAFWRWWPTLYQSVHTLRITGGEPLLSKHTWRLLDLIGREPRADLTLAINTNMGVAESFIERLIEAEQALSPQIAEFQVYTSCESHGAQAEYVRFGMNYPEFIGNIQRYLASASPAGMVAIMATFNALSVPGFGDFLDEVVRLRRETQTPQRRNRLPISINYLRWPQFLGVRVLPRELREAAAERLARQSQSYLVSGDLEPVEAEQIARLCSFMLTEEAEPKLQRDRDDFGKFIVEYDRRRQTDFRAVFPSLGSFLEDCLRKR